MKRTVNFDDPGTYHLYYGDRMGRPGTILTFFPFPDAAPGRAGPGMASATAYVVAPGALQFWMARLVCCLDARRCSASARVPASPWNMRRGTH